MLANDDKEGTSAGVPSFIIKMSAWAIGNWGHRKVSPHLAQILLGKIVADEAKKGTP